MDYVARKRLSILVVTLLFLAVAASRAASHPSHAQADDVQTDAAQIGASTLAAPGIRLLSADDNGLTLQIQTPPLQHTALGDAAAGAGAASSDAAASSAAASSSAAAASSAASISRLHMPGYASLSAPGLPELPQRSLVIALPPGAVPHIRRDVAMQRLYHISGITVAPAPQTELAAYDYGDPHAVPEFTTSRAPNQAAYALDAFYPAEPVSLGSETWLRQQRVVTLRLNPVQVNAARGAARVYTELLIHVDFEYPQGRPPAQPTRPESAVFEQILQRTLLNYEQARAWRQPTAGGTAAAPLPAAVASASPCLGSNAFRIALQEDGIYALTHQSLANAGMPAAVAASTLRMCHRDQEIDIQLLDANGNNQFESGDTILFFGAALRTQETDTNIYWLTYGGSAGQRMTQTAANPNGAPRPAGYAAAYHLEQDNSYYSRIPTLDLNDHWYWRAPLNSASDNTLSITFSLDNLVTAPQNAAVPIRAELWGWIQHETHSYRVKLNGYTVDTTNTFTGSGVSNASHTFDASSDAAALINNGVNTLTIEAIKNANLTDHLMLVNWAEITVQRQFVASSDRLLFNFDQPGNWEFSAAGFSAAARIFDVTDPDHPVALTTTASGPGDVIFSQTISAPRQYALAAPNGYLTPLSITKDTTSNLRGTGQQADYIIITDPLLNNALSPLISRRQQEYSVKKVYVQDIFDEFSYGIFDPLAIRDFLQYTAEQWQTPAPTFVLLAGDATYDYTDNLGLQTGNEALVPAFLRSGVDSNLGEAVADNQYVDFNGDNLADMLLGRLPARTASELTNMINKIIAYENAPADLTWQGSHLILSDNGYLPSVVSPPDCEQDPAGDFFNHVDEFVQAFLPNSQTLHRVYYAPPECYPQDSPYYTRSAEETTLRFLPLFTQGHALVSYVGHSSIVEWGKEKYLTTSLVSQLQNGSRTPIMLPMTCLVGFYHQPQGDSLSEMVLKSTQGGSVASYTPSGLQVQHGHDFLLEGFYAAIYQGNAVVLGDAIFGAKQQLYNGDTFGVYEDLQDTYMLLGDPALRLNICTQCTRTFLPASISQ